MYTSSNTWCVCLISFLSSKAALLLSCGISNFTENLIAEEFSFINISYTINITGSSLFADYKVCEENVTKTACNFVKDTNDISFSSMFGKDLSVKTGITCYWEQREVSSSVVAVDIHITQVVTRSMSAMIFSTSTRGMPKPTRVISVEVLYPPKITSLIVDGQEVNGYYIIDNSQEVNVSCYFEKGNPPAVFRLLVNNGTELISSHDEEHLHHLLTAQCEDNWPMVSCEGNGTKQNRSVKFIVRCPPQFVDVSTEIYITSARDTIEFPVKAHTTSLTACFLTSVSVEDITKRNVSCTLNGKPPYLSLRLRPDTETIAQGNWTLTLGNEIGSANATISVLASTASPSKAALPANITTALVCGCVATVVIIAVVSLTVVRKVKRQRHEVAVMKGTSENLQGTSSINLCTSSSQKKKHRSGCRGQEAIVCLKNEAAYFGTQHYRFELYLEDSTEVKNIERFTRQTAIIVNDLFEASERADSNNIVIRNPSMPPSSEVPARPSYSRLPAGDTQSETVYHNKAMITDCCEPGSSSSETSENTYVSALEVREEKRVQKKERETYVAKAINADEMMSPHLDAEKKPSCTRNADGLIYGDLVFTNTSVYKVIIGSEEKTEYTEIKVTSPRQQTDTGRKKIEDRSND